MDRAARYRSTSASTKHGDFPPGEENEGMRVSVEDVERGLGQVTTLGDADREEDSYD